MDRKVALKRLYQKCETVGAKFNQKTAQEFPGWAVSKVIEQDRFIPVHWLLTDYFKEKYGTLESKHNEIRKELDDFTSHSHELNSGAVVDSRVSVSNFNDIDFRNLAKHLPTIERACLILRERWGFEIKEIADVIGYSQDNVYQKLAKAKRIMRSLVFDATV